MCSYSNCPLPNRLYGSRREWLEHEESQHRKIWSCRFHTSLQFRDQQSLERHLREESHQNMTEENVKAFASISESTSGDIRSQCPICLEKTDCISHFPAHLAHHMERIAVFSLPTNMDGEDGKTSMASDKVVLHSRDESELWGLDSNSDSSNASQPGKSGKSLRHGEILQWLAPDAFAHRRAPYLANVHAAVWQEFVNGPEFRAWHEGRELWRIYCCGSNITRLVCLAFPSLSD